MPAYLCYKSHNYLEVVTEQCRPFGIQKIHKPEISSKIVVSDNAPIYLTTANKLQ